MAKKTIPHPAPAEQAMSEDLARGIAREEAARAVSEARATFAQALGPLVERIAAAVDRLRGAEEAMGAVVASIDAALDSADAAERDKVKRHLAALVHGQLGDDARALAALHGQLYEVWHEGVMAGLKAQVAAAVRHVEAAEAAR